MDVITKPLFALSWFYNEPLAGFRTEKPPIVFHLNPTFPDQ